MGNIFKLVSNFTPKGDQPKAIETITKAIDEGKSHVCLLGATGTGKTFTIANVIANTNRPAIIMAPNKTLAAQLYGEFKDFFPNNAVEYFISYYDYYQPEAYVAASDSYIEKDASINENIEQMRLSATKAILERQDTIIIASVSAIYGLGAPETYLQMVFKIKPGDNVSQRTIVRRLVDMQYTRTNATIERGQFRARGEIIDIFISTSELYAIRIELFDDEVESIVEFDPLTGEKISKPKEIAIHPTSLYATPKDKVMKAAKTINEELIQRLEQFKQEDKLVELQRLDNRTRNDIEMMQELGYCNGIENYSRHLTGRKAGGAPPTLFDYLPNNTLVFMDESHISIPQIGGMYKGDRSRKENLVNHGFRLPSALDNRPMKFDEWESSVKQMVMVSATPSTYESEKAQVWAEQVIRPTGILDPVITVKPSSNQVDDLLNEINIEIKKGNRILTTVLTKKLAEQLSSFLTDHGIKAIYLHSDIDAIERMAIIQQLRIGTYDVLVGINLLREGIDMPEVGLVTILDADKEGFLRSTRSLVQTIGRAARNVSGRVILYGDRTTDSMTAAMDETSRRRQKQKDYNTKHGLSPQGLNKPIKSILTKDDDGEKNLLKASFDKNDVLIVTQETWIGLNAKQQKSIISQLKKRMKKQVEILEFEQAALIRDTIAKYNKWNYM